LTIAMAVLTSVAGPTAAPSLTVTDDHGTVSIEDAGRTIARFAPKTAQSNRGPASVLTVSGRRVIEVRLPVRGEPAGRAELWVAERSNADTKVIWWNVVGPLDADGETSLVVRVTEDGIEEYQTAARLSRCDGATVPLFRRTWDFAARAFRPGSPDLPPRSGETVTARRGNAPDGKPLGGFFFTAASSTPNATTQAAQLRPPSAVNDGNPETAWSTTGSGRGHLLTARSSSGFAITGLRLLPGDTSTQARYLASARPRRLTLIFGPEAPRNVDVDLLEDADGGRKRFRDPYWIALPKPVTASCVTVVVRDVTSEKAPMAIADLEVLTELDGPEAADRLVASLAQGTSCPARIPLLARIGAPAFGKLSAALGQSPPGVGRACLLEAADALITAGIPADQDLGRALVSAIEQATHDEERLLLKLLPAIPTPPEAAVSAVLLDDQRTDESRARAARVLAALDRDEARASLLAAVGRGSRALRKQVRGVVTALPRASLALVLAQLDATPTEATARRADLLAIVGAFAVRTPEARAAALRALRAALAGGASFEEQARAIQGLGLLRDAPSLDALIAVRAKSENAVLRSLAIEELAKADGAAVLVALRAALEDTDPQVRETAADSLGRKGDKQAAALLIAGAEQEPWPGVRRAEIGALGELCTPEGNELLLRAFQRDVEEVRQTALRGIDHCYQGKAIGTLLRTVGRQAEGADMRSLAVRLLAARKDPRLVPALTEVMSRLLVEAQADLSVEAVIADTAMALAAIGNTPAVETIAKLVSDSRPSVQRFAVDALATVCDPGPGAQALRAAAQAKDESVAIPAATAEARCRDRR
jgi:HEAT repeat protein